MRRAARCARVIARDGSAKVVTRFVRPAAWKDQPNQLQNVASLCNFIISFFCFLKNQFFCSKTSDLLLCDQKNLVLWLAGMKMARDEAQHGTFSEPTRTGIHTTTQRGTVPSCIDMVHRRKRIAWLVHRWWRRNAAGVDSVQAQGMVGCRPGIVGVNGDRDGCMA